MLQFNRPSFRSGVMRIKEAKDTGKKDAEGNTIYEYRVTTLKPSDNGEKIEFLDDDEILKRYPNFFRTV